MIPTTTQTNVQLPPLNRRRSVYDRLGTPVYNNLSVSQAFANANLLYPVEKTPMFQQMPDGNFVEVDDRRLLRRTDNWKVLDVVSNGYEIIQNGELVQWLEPLRNIATLSAVGGENGHAWALFKGKEWNVEVAGRAVGDPVRIEYLVEENKKVGFGFNIKAMILRLMCVNGVIVPDLSSSIIGSFTHVSGVNLLAQYVARAIANVGALENGMEEWMNRLGGYRAGNDEFNEILDAAYAIPAIGITNQRLAALVAAGNADPSIQARLMDSNVTAEQNLARVGQARNEVRAIYDTEIREHDIYGTLWGQVQAVFAQADHVSVGPRRSQSAAFGQHADVKIRALRKALDIAKVNRVEEIEVQPVTA